MGLTVGLAIKKVVSIEKKVANSFINLILW